MTVLALDDQTLVVQGRLIVVQNKLTGNKAFSSA
jgi:hypothetical protein